MRSAPSQVSGPTGLLSIGVQLSVPAISTCFLRLICAALKKLCNHPEILMLGGAEGEDGPQQGAPQQVKMGKKLAGNQRPAHQESGPSSAPAASPWVPPGTDITKGDITSSGSDTSLVT
jgi:hypothetical protein